MLRNCFCLLTVAIFLFSCRSNEKAYTKFLNKDSLPSRFISIDNTRDTVLYTANGAIIKIEKGSFSKDNVKLELKEAYSLEQIILAGLTTESDGKPLSSGGMIYLNAVEDNVTINKAINVSIPTTSFDEDMQLYKGEEKDGKINWVDPEPLKDTVNPYFESGRVLFEQNCASCHAMDKILSGPALSGVEGRGPWNSRERLIKFTQIPAAFIPRTCYTRQLLTEYGGAIMPGFVVTEGDSIKKNSVEDLNKIYDYIHEEDRKKGIVYSTNYNPSCDDSCYVYDSLLAVVSGVQKELWQERRNLIRDNNERINFEQNFQPVENVLDTFDYLLDSSDYVITELPVLDKVVPVNYKTVYYEFEIKSFGWYNIDHLLDNGVNDAELKVGMTGDYAKDMSVFIVVPQHKVFAEGGPLKEDNNLFGFFTTDGKIPLPEGTEVIVFAVGEADGEIVFDFKKFISAKQQLITLQPKKVSKKEFNRAVKKFRLDDVKIEADDSKNADDIRKTDKQIKKNESLLEMYRPKNCDCNCGDGVDSAMVVATPSLMK